jgi:hypothetical protein
MGQAEFEGEVATVCESQVPKPADPYKTLVVFPLVVIMIPFVLGLVMVMRLATAFLRIPGGGCGGGLVGILSEVAIFRGLLGHAEIVPRLEIVLRDDVGGFHSVVAVGHQSWPQPASGDRLRIHGWRWGGVVRLSGGANLTTGVNLRSPLSPYKILVIAGLVVLLALYLAGLFARLPGRSG